MQMINGLTNDEKREVRDLYQTLAEKNGWAMPETWEGDKAAIAGDPINALATLRNLVADLTPIYGRWEGADMNDLNDGSS